VPDAIPPPAAHRPDEVCALVSAALSDGDLDAAMAHYEAEPVTAPGDGRIVRGRTALRQLLAAAAATRRLYTVDVALVLEAGDLALVQGTWRSSGADERGAPVSGTGSYCSVVRRGADGTWRIAVDSLVFEQGVS
jgi:ketosteroid isomerase-like protein